MKYFNYITIIVLLFIGFTSCNTDNEGEKYTPKVQGISFESSEIDQTINDANLEVPIRVIRSNVSSAYTAKYTATLSDGTVLSDGNSGSVSFAAGEGISTIQIKAVGMKPGSTYTVKLAFSDVTAMDTITKSGNSSMTVSIMRNYVWSSVGKVKWIESFFVDNDPVAVTLPLEKADGTNYYRIGNIQYTISGADNGTQGIYLYFYLDDNYNAVSISPANTYFYSGYYAGSTKYYYYYNPTTYPSYCNFANNGSDYSGNILVGKTNTAFSWTTPFEFIWTDGYPKQ